MPDIAVVIAVDDTVKNLLDGIIVIWAQYHQTRIAFMEYNIFADYFAESTRVEEFSSEKAELVERIVLTVSPVKREFITAIGVVGKIAGVHAVGNHKNLNIVE